MSEIRERAKEWLKAPVSMVRAEDIVVDLLTELERVENSREAECMECEKLACTEIRQQAAREAVEIAEVVSKGHKPGSWDQQACLSVARAIKSHFGMEGWRGEKDAYCWLVTMANTLTDKKDMPWQK